MAERLLTRGEIIDVLSRWQAGALTAEQVHDWAESLYMPGHIEVDDREGEDQDSVALEVLGALDLLDMNLMLPEDIPIYLEFLNTPSGQFAEGYRKFDEAIAQIDPVARQKQLKDVPFYAPYCRTN